MVLGIHEVHRIFPKISLLNKKKIKKFLQNNAVSELFHAAIIVRG